MRHFSFYSQISYKGTIATDISLRAKIRDALKNESYIYYLHTVHDDERPDIIAAKYYGNSSYTWAIFYANDIFDPIEEWPLSSEAFYSMIQKKYGSVQLAQETIHHYLLDDTYEIDKTTYEDVNLEADRKKAISIYDYEFQKNEDKRKIKIIDANYITQITNELKNLWPKS